MSNNYTEYEINDNRNKTLSVEENLNKIRPYLQDIINDLKKFDTSKIQLRIKIVEERVMHPRSDNIEMMINDKANELIEELFQSRLFRYQTGLETSKKGGKFIFD